MANIYRVDFQVIKAAAQGKSGPAFMYRKPVRTALVSCANDQAIQSVLNADIPVTGGEAIEIVHASQITLGTEGVGLF